MSSQTAPYKTKKKKTENKTVEKLIKMRKRLKLQGASPDSCPE